LSGVGETHASTGTALILVGGDGENMIAVVAGANAAVLPGDVSKAALGAGDVVLMQQEIPLETIRAALEAARAAGAISVLNTAPYSDDAVDLLELADYVVANETEFDLWAGALGLKGEDREARMRDFVARTGHAVIVTLGGEGVLAAAPEGFFRVAALAVTPIDTVGAGDTFCGYLGAALERGEPLEAALRRAAVAGSLACLKPGAQPAIPLGEDVEARL
jgi:ribokinase